MVTQELTIRVTPEAARIYQAASEQQRRKLDLLLSLQLSEAARRGRSLKQIMHDMSEKAQARGLTEEKLDELLRDE